MAHIVLVSNDLQSRELLQPLLNNAGHRVTVLCDGENALNYLQQQVVDLVLLDHHYLCEQTLQLITVICERFAIPTLLLTSLSDELNALEGLKAGADLYLQKPYSNKALLVHIEVLVRRVSLEKQRLAFQNCSQQFSLKISRLPLTETEMLLIQYLSKNGGNIISKATLQKEVLKKELSAFDRNLDVHISNIRRKMLNAGLSKLHIKTVHGKGYTFLEQVV